MVESTDEALVWKSWRLGRSKLVEARSNKEGSGLNRLKIKSENAGKVELRVGMRGKLKLKVKNAGERQTQTKNP